MTMSEESLAGTVSCCLRRVVLGNDNLVVGSSDSPGVMDLLYMSNLSDDSNMSSHHLMESLDDVLVVSKSVSAHDMVQFVDHSVGMSSSMSNYGVKLIDESMMLNNGVHLVLVHLHITF